MCSCILHESVCKMHVLSILSLHIMWLREWMESLVCLLIIIDCIWWSLRSSPVTRHSPLTFSSVDILLSWHFPQLTFSSIDILLCWHSPLLTFWLTWLAFYLVDILLHWPPLTCDYDFHFGRFDVLSKSSHINTSDSLCFAGVAPRAAFLTDE